MTAPKVLPRFVEASVRMMHGNGPVKGVNPLLALERVEAGVLFVKRLWEAEAGHEIKVEDAPSVVLELFEKQLVEHILSSCHNFLT